MYRPEIIPELPFYAHLMGGLAFGLLVVMWVLSIRWYKMLPRIIPIHWGLDMKPDGYGNKVFIFLMPAIYTILFISFVFTLREPWTFNYPEPLTPENYEDQYCTALIVLRAILLGVGLLFTGILFLMKRVAMSK